MLRQAASALTRSLLPSSLQAAAAAACPHLLHTLPLSAADTAEVASCSGLQHQHYSTRSWSTSRRMSTGAAAVAEEPAAEEGLVVDDSAVTRLKQLQQESPGETVALRIEVEGGGCSGFQYVFKLDSNITPEDRVFEKDGARVVCDTVSLEFLKGAKVEFEESLMRSAFQIAANPNSEATCGCGSSFTAKM